MDQDNLWNWARRAGASIFYYDPNVDVVPGVDKFTAPDGTVPQTTQMAMTNYTKMRIKRDYMDAGISEDAIDEWLVLCGNPTWRAAADGNVWTIMLVPPLSVGTVTKDVCFKMLITLVLVIMCIVLLLAFLFV